MANDNQDALTKGALFLGGGVAGYAAGRWIVDRWLDSKEAPRPTPPAPAAASTPALPPAAPSPPRAPTAPARPPSPPRTRGSDGLAWSASRLPRRSSEANRPGRSSDEPYRDASWFSIKTPGVILAELNAARNEVESLGRDIYATFRRPFKAQLAAAEEKFLKTYGRKPGVGRAAQDTDYQIVHSWMRPVPTADDLRYISYQGQFVYQWGEFEREFGNFWAAHAHSWTDRMWRGSYDKAVEYRQRAADWRKRFEEIGGKPTTPPPKPPTEHFLPPGISVPWKAIAVVGGIAAGALIIPAAIRASRR